MAPSYSNAVRICHVVGSNLDTQLVINLQLFTPYDPPRQSVSLRSHVIETRSKKHRRVFECVTI